MRAAPLVALGLLFADYSASAARSHPDKGELPQRVEAAKDKCQAQAKGADPNQIPGAFEVCIASEANAAPAAVRDRICKLAIIWAGFMSEGKCYIDAE
jgi:hypothetical protein